MCSVSAESPLAGRLGPLTVAATLTRPFLRTVRISKYNATGGIVAARYFDTYSFRSVGMKVPGMGCEHTHLYLSIACWTDHRLLLVLTDPAGSRIARGFYGALLDQKVYWEQTMRAENTVRFELPERNDTNGRELADKVYHSLVRDMIIRANTWFPKCGQPSWSPSLCSCPCCCCSWSWCCCCCCCCC